MSKYTVLTKDEEIYHIQNYINNNNIASRDLVLDSQMGVVINTAKRLSGSDYDLLPDLVQEGALCLLGCIERFDLTKGFRFSSFVGRSVLGAMLDYLKPNADLIKQPASRDSEFNLHTIQDSMQTSSPENITEHEELISTITAFIETLEPLHKDCLLCRYGDTRQKDVMRRYGKTPGSITHYAEKELNNLRGVINHVN